MRNQQVLFDRLSMLGIRKGFFTNSRQFLRDKITRDLSLYLRQGGPDYARDQAAIAWLDHDIWDEDDRLW